MTTLLLLWRLVDKRKTTAVWSSVFFSLENVAVTFKLSSEKIQTRLKLKK